VMPESLADFVAAEANLASLDPTKHAVLTCLWLRTERESTKDSQATDGILRNKTHLYLGFLGPILFGEAPSSDKFASNPIRKKHNCPPSRGKSELLWRWGLF